MRQLESAQRFMRPVDLGRTRRNQRQMQVQRLLVISANVLLAGVVVLGITWVVRHTREDARFQIRKVDAIGAKRTPRATIEAAVAPYVGTNLFRIDIDRVGSVLRALPWVAGVAIEKQLPGTLVIHVTEREPVALARVGNDLRYVDRQGVVFAPLSPEVGDPELPMISGGAAEEMKQTVDFLAMLRQSSPELYARVSEIAPVDSTGFAVFDRDLRTLIYMQPADAVEKWQTLYRLAAAEGYGPQEIEYADLRFRERVVVKPRKLVIAMQQPRAVVSGAITN